MTSPQYSLKTLGLSMTRNKGPTDSQTPKEKGGFSSLSSPWLANRAFLSSTGRSPDDN